MALHVGQGLKIEVNIFRCLLIGLDMFCFQCTNIKNIWTLKTHIA